MQVPRPVCRRRQAHQMPAPGIVRECRARGSQSGQSNWASTQSGASTEGEGSSVLKGSEPRTRLEVVQEEIATLEATPELVRGWLVDFNEKVQERKAEADNIRRDLQADKPAWLRQRDAARRKRKAAKRRESAQAELDRSEQALSAAADALAEVKARLVLAVAQHAEAEGQSEELLRDLASGQSGATVLAQTIQGALLQLDALPLAFQSENGITALTALRGQLAGALAFAAPPAGVEADDELPTEPPLR